MTLRERFPDFGEPIIVYAPFQGRIGIFGVQNLGNSLTSELLGYL